MLGWGWNRQGWFQWLLHCYYWYSNAWWCLYCSSKYQRDGKQMLQSNWNSLSSKWCYYYYCWDLRESLPRWLATTRKAFSSRRNQSWLHKDLVRRLECLFFLFPRGNYPAMCSLIMSPKALTNPSSFLLNELLFIISSLIGLLINYLISNSSGQQCSQCRVIRWSLPGHSRYYSNRLRSYAFPLLCAFRSALDSHLQCLIEWVELYKANNNPSGIV